MNSKDKHTFLTQPELELEVMDRWHKDDVKNKATADKPGQPSWVFHEGPPTANGKPGVHHVLARTFKDVFSRYHRMLGYNVTRKAGWDCHGLPVELETERRLSLRSKDEVERYGVAKFNHECRNSVLTYEKDWDDNTERLGFWLDTENPYQTMDTDYVESVWWSLSQVFNKGLLYHSKRVVPHCPRCQTTLSSHELAQGYKDKESQTAYVKFPLVDEDASLLVWTTTPWTLPANMLVAVNKHDVYVTCEVDKEKLVLSENAKNTLFPKAKVLATYNGSHLVGKTYQPPFSLYQTVPVSYTVQAGDFVSSKEGTGLVHLAPAHGVDDFALGQKLSLPALTPVLPDASYNDKLPQFQGQNVFEAESDLLQLLADEGLLLKTESLTHRYPHCWRCQTPLVYLAKSTWYAKTTAVADKMLAFNDQVKWHPEHVGQGRFGDWLRNNVDWALSRERYWGTPLPLWLCPEGHVRCLSSRKELEGLVGHEVHDLHRSDVDQLTFSCHCGQPMKRTPEVLDVWWDSGAMPFAQHHYPFENKELLAQADFVCEGLDQTRGWFYSLLAVSTLVFDESPYKNVLCLGLVADKDGQKMSKTRGNTVSPSELFSEYGADAVRWYFLTAKQPWDGYNFSTDELRERSGDLTTLRHVVGFYKTYAEASSMTAARLSKTTQTTVLDRWLLARLQTVTENNHRLLSEYDATAAARELQAFVDETSNWYLRLSRRRLWSGDEAAFSTLHYTLSCLSQLLAPLTPFLADYLWAELGNENSVHLTRYPETETNLKNNVLEVSMKSVQELTHLARTERAKAKLPLRQPLAEASFLMASEDERELAEDMNELLRQELNVKRLTVTLTPEHVASWVVKPNYRVLGPRFQQQMPLLAEALQEMDASLLAKELKAGPVMVLVKGSEETLTANDLDVSLQAKDGFGLETSGSLACSLKTALSPDLEEEGLVRELVHELQMLRRQMNLDVSDRVALTLQGDKKLLEAALKHRDYLCTELLAVSFKTDKLSSPHRLKVKDYKVEVGLSKVSK